MKKPSILLAVVLVAASLPTACGREGPLPPPDETPPQVNSTIPANGSVDVPVNLGDGITILFSEVMDASTINDQTITLTTGQNPVPGSITYQDSAGVSVAVFTPSSILNPATLYKITVDSNVKDSYGIPMAAPYLSSFSTGTAASDTTPPSVADTTPGNGNVNVQPNAPIIITVSEPVDPATIVFTLSAGSTIVPCTMSYSGTTAIFTPSSGLNKNTQFTATVSAGVRDLAGNAMPNDYSWSFTTIAASDTTPPVVTATAPAAGATHVDLNVASSVTFSEPVDPATIVFTLSAGSTIVPCTMSYSGTTAIFTPSSGLNKNTQFTATVSAGVRDLAGNAMPNDYSWSFTTIAASDTTPPVVTATAPAAGATHVDLNVASSVTFSEPVDPATIVFTLRADSAAVPGTMSYRDSGATAIFTPSSALKKDTRYTAWVSAGVRDLAGNAMPKDYSWNFTTGKH
jgi:predicted small lipoprotein YifL